MSTWSVANSLLTTVGKTLLSYAQAGNGGLTITKVVPGEGRVAESGLVVQTAVTTPKDEMVVINTISTATGTILNVQLNNIALAAAYDLNQIGIYATNPNTGEVLYLLAQCDEGTADTIPLPADTPVVMNFSFNLLHGVEAVVTVTVSPAGLVSSELFNAQVHGNISNAGKVGTVAALPLITGVGGIVQVGAFGTAAGSFAQGNDARLTDVASTTLKGLAPQATAPASGLRNVLAIENGETVYTNKAVFDATSPATQAIGDSAAVGTALTSARRDHKHAMPVGNDLLASIKTIDGATSGLDADLLDGLHASAFMLVGHQYIIRWDKTNSQCTRMGDSAAITTTITNFKHSGSVNGSYSNPFDSLYPWSERKLCKVDRAAYAALEVGSPITDAVTQWEDEPGFTLDGSGDFDGVYTPEFWGAIWEDATYVYAGVADGAIPGWQYFEATIGGRYFGSLDGATKVTSIAGSFPWRNTAVSTMHTNATSQELTLDDIYTWSADTLLLCVEFATLNTQIAVGLGCDGLYRASNEYVGANASQNGTLLKLPNAFVAYCVAGAIIALGTGNDGEQTGIVRFVSSANLDGGDALVATHKAVTVSALPANVTTGTFVSVHGCYNAPDTGIGSMSGYIGTEGKCNAYYRGRISHANFWRYVLGAYRETATGAIWVAHNRVEAAAADALNTGVHHNTGLVLPESAANYIATMSLYAMLPLAPFTKTVGGSGGSTNPVGDYTYTPSLVTANTILLLGGNSVSGAACGRFSGTWNVAAAGASWDVGALPFF